MKMSRAIPISILGITFLSVLATFGLAVGDLRHDPVLRELWIWSGRAWTGLCGLMPLLAVLAVVIALYEGARWAHIHTPLIYHQRGNLPASADSHIRIWADHRNERAEIAQAIFNGHADRANGSSTKALLAPPPDDQILLPEPAPTITASNVLTGYDPQREPHWLLIGQTGSGKSHAVFEIAQHLASRFNSHFLIAERGGIDWNTQADARTVEGYATLLDTVEVERQRRGAMMRATDVDHISGLQERLPLLVVIIEEAESVYGRLFELDRMRAKQFTTTLRDIASQGRKQGIALIVATQTGTSGVFDAPTRRNLGNTLIFRSEAIVGDQFGVPRSAGLATLPSGTAYALKYGSTVAFPMHARPALPHSDLYHEGDGQLLLAADAEADGLGEDDQPDCPTVATGYNRPNGGGYPAVVPVVRLDNGRKPTPAEAAAIRLHYRRTGSKTSTCMRFYGYKDGPVWRYVESAIEGKI